MFKSFFNTSVAVYWGAEFVNILFVQSGECELIWVVREWICSPPRLLSSGYRQLFPGVKKRDDVAYHSSTTSAEIKNEWN